MTITIAANSVPKPPAEIIEGFRGAPTSVISDNLARLPGAVGLKPYHRGGKLVGTAFTVRTRPGDNLAIHRALELVGRATSSWSTAVATRPGRWSARS